jgi:hypothetical protein
LRFGAQSVSLFLFDSMAILIDRPIYGSEPIFSSDRSSMESDDDRHPLPEFTFHEVCLLTVRLTSHGLPDLHIAPEPTVRDELQKRTPREVFAVHDWQAADLMLDQQVGGLIQKHVGRHRNDRLGHYGIYSRVLKLAYLLAKIPVGDYSDELVIFDHWQSAKSALVHLPQRFNQHFARPDRDGVLGHPRTDLHRRSPFTCMTIAIDLSQLEIAKDPPTVRWSRSPYFYSSSCGKSELSWDKYRPVGC